MPTTDVTRPPPTAGPRLRNFMFSSGSLDLLSSSLVAVVEVAAAFSPSADVFLSAPAGGVCGVAPVFFLERSPVLVCDISRLGTPSIRTKTKIVLKSVFIGKTPADSRKADANHTANAGVLYKSETKSAGPVLIIFPLTERRPDGRKASARCHQRASRPEGPCVERATQLSLTDNRLPLQLASLQQRRQIFLQQEPLLDEFFCRLLELAHVLLARRISLRN